MVSHKPPPRHGASRAVEVLLEGPTPGLVWRHVDARYSETIAQLQKLSLRKLRLLGKYLIETIRASRGADGILLTPSLQAGTFLKDSVFIWASWLFVRKPIVAWYHMRFETMRYAERNVLMRWYVRWTLRRVWWHVCVAPCLLQGMPEFLRRDSLVALPNGIPSVGAPAPGAPPADGVVRVLFVSNLGDDKGWRLLREVAERLCARIGDLRFDFYGAPMPDTSQEELDAVFGEGAHRERICYRGILEEKDKEAVFRGADILAFPSYNEAFPITLLEAISVGLPIVATDVGGIADAVRDGEGGFLVPTRDGDAMERRLETLIADPELRRKFGKFNLRHFGREYTAEAYCGRWSAFLSGRANRRPEESGGHIPS